MEKSVFILIIVSALSGCSNTSVYLGVGHNFNNDHINSNPVGVLRVNKRINHDTSCGYLHVSNVFDGKPFNNNEETVSDIIHCGYEFK